MQVDGRTARLEFQGAWALFGLLQVGRAAPADLLGLRNEAPNILGFEIPVERDPAQPPLVEAGPGSPF